MDTPTQTRAVLNIGGNSKDIAIPEHFNDWRHDILDIDPSGNPEIVCDAREMLDLPPATYDAIYCSHNLEHYYFSDIGKVLTGMLHILKDDGFVHIRVPDIQEVMRYAVTNNIDINGELYKTSNGLSITVGDVVWGWQAQIAQSGEDFFAHKYGFSPTSLDMSLKVSGFKVVGIKRVPEMFEVVALAFKNPPTDFHKQLLDLG